jgi:hypothetical protein
LSLVSKFTLALLLLPFAAGCADDSTGAFEAAVRVDPCEPAVLALDPDATAEQETGVRAAMELWNRGAAARLSLTRAAPGQVVNDAPDASSVSHDGAAAPSPGSTVLPIRFRRAAAPSHGYFNPETGEILINLDLTSQPMVVAIAHEVGHAFGLVHVSGRPSVMTSGNLSITPTEGDVAELAKLWGACPPAAQPPSP